ncbi:MAG: hypothetical protein J6T20_01340 [Treponema sp.]|nr:hypothetical protein [Treponema sp.]
MEKNRKRYFFFLLLLVFIFGFLVFLSVHKPLSESEPYVYSMELLNQNKTVKEYLGDKIKRLSVIKVIIDENEDGSGKAEIILLVKGNKGKGILYVNSIKQNNEWRYSKIEFDTKTGNTGIINLIN